MYASIAGVPDRHRWVNDRVMLFQKGDELLHLRGVQIKGSRPLARFGETGRRARFLDVGHEVQHDEIHMLDLVRTIPHKLFGNHSRRHVPADPQPAFVGFFRDHGNKLRLDRAVDFDLHIPKVGIMVHPIPSLVRSSRQNLHGPLKRTGAIDKSGEDESRPELFALLNMLPQLAQFVD